MEFKVKWRHPALAKARAGAGQSAAPAALPESIQRRIQDHPCYSEEAHHHFARMHLPVAPVCNIQCHYCNRRYDCANESRPGVVSELLTPEQAVTKALAVAAALPQLAVLGIAGPGDPLANPERTFATCQALTEKAPDLKLCLSTNGLALPQYADELAKHHISHVTITINCIEPDIGARIYPWIVWEGRRRRGRPAAEILIEQQLKGLELLVARDLLVKINSVMIPGVNDAHLLEVNRVVKQKGAFLHNIVPLIARPEHGAHYGRTGQREPTATELQALQDACGDAMRMMRHCRQCRSDAIGLLGQDRHAEFSREPAAPLAIDYPAAMAKRARFQAAIRERIQARRAESRAASPPVRLGGFPGSPRPVVMAVATQGEGLINQHFGQAREFLVYEASSAGVRLVGRRLADQYCTGPAECGDGDRRIPDIIRALGGCEVLLCAKIGIEPWGQLEAAGIQPDSGHAFEPIEAAVMAVYQELLAAGKLALPARRMAVGGN